MFRQIFFIAICSCVLISCATPNSEQIASQNKFIKKPIKTEKFSLTTFQKIADTNAIINVYIEGDGNVTSNKIQISSDPTPRSATVMQLAAQDPNPNVVYLARPCQFAPHDLQTVCESKYWTTARYSQVVVNSVNTALDAIKQQSNSSKINLIGFSGGATLAILVAAQRDDIASIRTIAGNLDLIAMQEYHRSAPLDESLDPMQVTDKIRDIPQLHFVGAKDKTVPPIVAENFRNKAQLQQSQVVVLQDATHHKGWLENWRVLLEQKL